MRSQKSAVTLWQRRAVTNATVAAKLAATVAAQYKVTDAVLMPAILKIILIFRAFHEIPK